MRLAFAAIAFGVLLLGGCSLIIGVSDDPVLESHADAGDASSD